MPSLTRTHIALAALLVLVVLVTLLLRPTPQTTPPVFYASSTGSGQACSETAPCREADRLRLSPAKLALVARVARLDAVLDQVVEEGIVEKEDDACH